jgi:hypothetical protein
MSRYVIQKSLTPGRNDMTKLAARASGIALAALMATALSPVNAQDRSGALAKELTGLLQQHKLDSVAARHPAAADQFVAALYFPGQLLVVWARTSAPAILNEKLIRREFREVYIDLNSASIPESRVMITDGGADGLRSRREPNRPFDMQDLAGKGIRFDGNWREDKMSEQDYMKAFSLADDVYLAALQALVAELKKAP